MNEFDIVIVNWNTGLRLQDCLQSILPAAPAAVFHSLQCIVVDNASTDGSADNLEAISQSLTMIRNQENKGFAYACNQGAGVGQSEYILFLNPDIKLFPGSLVKALGFLDQQGNERVGILGIQLISVDGVIQRNVARFPTPKSLFYQMLGLDRIWPHRFPSHFMIDWDHRESRQVDQVTGAFFLVRRQLFEELNGFDDRFFMYYEDMDFAYRAKQSGWSSFYLADAQAFHFGGGSSSQVKARRLFYLLRSRVLYVAKHYGIASAISILAVSFIVEFGVRLVRSLSDKSKKDLSATIQAYWLLLGSIPRLLGQFGM